MTATAREHRLWMLVAKASRRGRWYRPVRGERMLAMEMRHYFQHRRDGAVRIGGIWRADWPSVIAARAVQEPRR